MNPREAGFLLLSSHLGNPDRRVLTDAQLRTLSQRMAAAEFPREDRDLVPKDLLELGYGFEMACRIVNLLEEEELLRHYLRRAERAGCVPITRVSPGYPLRLRKRLGMEAPGCLWAKGDLSILDTPMVSLVGSRDLNPENREFAREAGRQAALQGYTLVSGNARGADRTAQEGCLAAGGQVVSVVADALEGHSSRAGMLLLSENAFDEMFSAQRALSRNRCIHAMGEKTLVAQSRCQIGGTWDGTVKNLRHHWSSVFCFADGSAAMEELIRMGANGIGIEELSDLAFLQDIQENIFDRQL